MPGRAAHTEVSVLPAMGGWNQATSLKHTAACRNIASSAGRQNPCRRGARRLCAPSTIMCGGFACTFHGHNYDGFPHLFLNWLPLLFVCAECKWRDPDLALGSPRGGGEVRILETERSDRVPAGIR